MANGITIDQLAEMCHRAQAVGLGSKMVLMSSDDEGNEYHELFFGFTENVRDVFSDTYAPFPPYGVTEKNIDDYVILG